MTLRAVFHDEGDARAVGRRLRADGFDVEVVRERFAGEDDDEDHAWAVVTDAPEFVVDVMVEEHDGWLDTDTSPRAGFGPGSPPLDLPEGPRRVKGHWQTD